MKLTVIDGTPVPYSLTVQSDEDLSDDQVREVAQEWLATHGKAQMRVQRVEGLYAFYRPVIHRYTVRPRGHTAWGTADTRHEATRLAREAGARGLRRIVIYDEQEDRVVGQYDAGHSSATVWWYDDEGAAEPQDR